MFEKFLQKFGKKEEAEEIEFKPFEEVPHRETEKEETPSAVKEEKAAPTGSDNVELRVIRPETYEDVSTVADTLLAGCTVVLNVEALDRPIVFRMLDFLNGVTYCTDGEIKKVAPGTFIITPHSNVDISDM